MTILLALFACGSTEDAPAETPAPTEQAKASKKKAKGKNKAKAKAGTVYGTAFTVKPKDTIKASALLKDPAPYVDKTVRVEGRVADVCQKAGCWMVIAEGDKTMRIRMKDHGFSVDKKGAGKTCEVEGTVVARKIDPKEVAHFESETSEGAPIPEHAAKDVVYEIEATSVKM